MKKRSCKLHPVWLTIVGFLALVWFAASDYPRAIVSVVRYTGCVTYYRITGSFERRAETGYCYVTQVLLPRLEKELAEFQAERDRRAEWDRRHL